MLPYFFYYSAFVLSLMFVQTSFAQEALPVQNNEVHQQVQFVHDQALLDLAKPFLLPASHPIKKTLDRLFSKTRVTESEAAFINAGFRDISVRSTSYLKIAVHPKMPGYVFKIYLDSEPCGEVNRTGAEWLIHRCRGAAFIRNLIKVKKMEHFTVPDKWLYRLPKSQKSNGLTKQPFILIAQRMDVVSHEKTKKAWETKVTPKLLRELYCILKSGYGSIALIANIPYTKNGKFTFIDTEFPKRKFNLAHVGKRLSEKMGTYWNQLILQDISTPPNDNSPF